MGRITKRNVANKHRQGAGWIVSTYDPGYDAWVESGEMSYWAACTAVRKARYSWDTKKQEYDRELEEDFIKRL